MSTLGDTVFKDLSKLTEAERQRVLEVLRRDDEIRDEESIRLGVLRFEIESLKQQATEADEEFNGKNCVFCRQRFGWITDRGDICPRCQRRKVCNSCRHVDTSTRWTCLLCHKQQQFYLQSGSWLHKTYSGRTRIRRNKDSKTSSSSVKDNHTGDTCSVNSTGDNSSLKSLDKVPNPNSRNEQNPPGAGLTGWNHSGADLEMDPLDSRSQFQNGNEMECRKEMTRDTNCGLLVNDQSEFRTKLVTDQSEASAVITNQSEVSDELITGQSEVKSKSIKDQLEVNEELITGQSGVSAKSTTGQSEAGAKIIKDQSQVGIKLIKGQSEVSAKVNADQSQFRAKLITDQSEVSRPARSIRDQSEVSTKLITNQSEVSDKLITDQSEVSDKLITDQSDVSTKALKDQSEEAATQNLVDAECQEPIKFNEIQNLRSFKTLEDLSSSLPDDYFQHIDSSPLQQSEANGFKLRLESWGSSLDTPEAEEIYTRSSLLKSLLSPQITSEKVELANNKFHPTEQLIDMTVELKGNEIKKPVPTEDTYPSRTTTDSIDVSLERLESAMSDENFAITNENEVNRNSPSNNIDITVLVHNLMAWGVNEAEQVFNRRTMMEVQDFEEELDAQGILWDEEYNRRELLYDLTLGKQDQILQNTKRGNADVSRLLEDGCSDVQKQQLQCSPDASTFWTGFREGDSLSVISEHTEPSSDQASIELDSSASETVRNSPRDARIEDSVDYSIDKIVQAELAFGHPSENLDDELDRIAAVNQEFLTTKPTIKITRLM